MLDPAHQAAHAAAAAKYSPTLRPDMSSVRVGFPFTPLTDLYYQLLKGSWLAVLLVFALGYLGANVVFALLYLAGGDCIAGAEPGSFADAFFFSVQSIATIGYGALTPATPYANALVTLESMVGILGVAMATGITFAKFARPRANMRFTDNLIISPYDGRRSLYFRVANVRGNDVVEAKIRVAALLTHETEEGHTLRRLKELTLVRDTTPLFRLSWLVVHVIDEDSPLQGMELEDLYRERIIFVVSLTGMDGTFAESVNARHVYLPSDVAFDHHFEDIMSDLPSGQLQFNFGKFHALRPLTPEERAAGSRIDIEEENAEALETEAEEACLEQDHARADWS